MTCAFCVSIDEERRATDDERERKKKRKLYGSLKLTKRKTTLVK